jgi:uridine phosphorylase
VQASMPFPHHPRKHREKALFTASEFHRYYATRTGSPPPRPPASVVLVFGQRWRTYLRRKFGGTFDPASGVFRVGRSVGIVNVHGPGAPYATIVVEELAALGVRRFVIVGLAGSLQPDLRSGAFVVSTRALRDEGTSHHYARPSTFAYPSAGLTDRLRGALRRANVPYVEGATWTTDAPYRETVPEIRRYRRMGILTVEMEAAAVFAVARHLGIEAAAVFVVSDHLDESGWEPRFHDTRAGLRAGLGVAVAGLARRVLRP